MTKFEEIESAWDAYCDTIIYDEDHSVSDNFRHMQVAVSDLGKVGIRLEEGRESATVEGCIILVRPL